MESARIVVVGSLNLDLFFEVARLPAPGETQLATHARQQPGGKGANQAAAAARLGAPTSMIGCVGQDAAAALLLAALEAEGVATDAVERLAGSAQTDSTQTGSAVVLLTPKGENSIVVAPGANAALTPAHLQRHARLLQTAGLLLTQLETPLSVLAEALALAGSVPVMLDPAPAAPLAPELLRQLTWFTPNETEARFYAGAAFAGSLDTEAQAHHLAAQLQTLGPRNILLKLGGRGAGVLTEASAWHFCPAPPVSVVDTTGAGDTLNAAFAAALLAGKTVPRALRFAVAAASLSVTRAGGLPSCPSLAEVTAFEQTLSPASD